MKTCKNYSVSFRYAMIELVILLFYCVSIFNPNYSKIMLHRYLLLKYKCVNNHFFALYYYYYCYFIKYPLSFSNLQIIFFFEFLNNPLCFLRFLIFQVLQLKVSIKNVQYSKFFLTAQILFSFVADF